jgi:plasmid stabilization system protein ParE
MSLPVFWTRFAENKLDDIYHYYALKASPEVAQKIVNDLLDRSIDLEKHPEMGPVEQLLAHRIQKFRYLIEGNYKIIYWVNQEPQRIEVFNVFDTRQNPNKIDEV